MKHDLWPNLPYAAWKDTYATLHLWTQIVGKIRLAQTPWLNHSWHVVLYVSPRGLTTSSIPYRDRSFELKFDFLNHALVATADDGSIRKVGLYPRSVADLHAEVIQSLEELGIDVRIHDMPNELPDPIRFNEDNTHASYDRDFAERHWRILAEVERVLFKFRTSFLGKCSPVHFFWGSFDLAVTPAGGPPFILGACLICRIALRERPIRTRSAARASGLATISCLTPRSTLMPIPSRRVSRRRRSARQRRFIATISANLSCLTTPSLVPRIRSVH